MDGGFIIADFHPLIADSPDGLIGIEEGCVEFKCPSQQEHGRTLVVQEPKKEYIAQIDWHLMVTGRGWCDFGSFCEDFPPHLQLWLKRFEAKDRDLDAKREKALAFVSEYQDHLERLGLSI